MLAAVRLFEGGLQHIVNVVTAAERLGLHYPSIV